MLTLDQLDSFGANTKTGVQRCANKEELYLRLVKMVPTNASFKALEESINHNDLDKAFQAAHALKGVLLSLELTPLTELVVEITDLLRNKTMTDYSNYLEKIETLRKKLEDICNN